MKGRGLKFCKEDIYKSLSSEYASWYNNNVLVLFSTSLSQTGGFVYKSVVWMAFEDLFLFRYINIPLIPETLLHTYVGSLDPVSTSGLLNSKEKSQIIW